MDIVKELLEIAVNLAIGYGIEVPPNGICIHEESGPVRCDECNYSNFCTTLSICQLNILGAMVHNEQPNVLEDLDKNFMLAASGIEPVIKEYN
jgi:hypothetical protein